MGGAAQGGLVAGPIAQDDHDVIRGDAFEDQAPLNLAHDLGCFCGAGVRFDQGQGVCRLGAHRFNGRPVTEPVREQMTDTELRMRGMLQIDRFVRAQRLLGHGKPAAHAFLTILDMGQGDDGSLDPLIQRLDQLRLHAGELIEAVDRQQFDLWIPISGSEQGFERQPCFALGIDQVVLAQQRLIGLINPGEVLILAVLNGLGEVGRLDA